MHRSNLLFVVVIVATSITLSACSQFEPFRRAGTWHENDAPMQNIAAELANKQDLYRGSGRPVLTGDIAETAIDGATTAVGASGGTSAGSSSTAGAATGGGGSGSSAGAGGGASAGGGMGGSTGGSTGGSMQ